MGKNEWQMSRIIPTDLHGCGYEGLACAVVYQCLVDIVTETYCRLDRRENGSEQKYTQNYYSAVRFLTAKDNPLYLLDIPGDELVKKTIRRTENDWSRKRKQR